MKANKSLAVAKTAVAETAAPTQDEMAAHHMALRDWAEVLACHAVDGATGYPQALRACSTAQEAVELCNETMSNIIRKAREADEEARQATTKTNTVLVSMGLAPLPVPVASSFGEGSPAHENAIRSVSVNIKGALRDYTYPWLPDGMTLGQIRGNFKLRPKAIKKVEKSAEALLVDQSKALADGLAEASKREVTGETPEHAQIIDLQNQLRVAQEENLRRAVTTLEWRGKFEKSQSDLLSARAALKALTDELAEYKRVRAPVASAPVASAVEKKIILSA